MKNFYKIYFDSISTSYGCFYVVKKSIDYRKTPYQEAEILELEFFGRSLVLDGKIQSTERDEYIYHEALVHPAMLTCPDPKTVLVIGGGEGATLREVLKHKSVKKAIMVDIDKDVVEMCKRHLHCMHQDSFEDQRTTLVFQDARKFVEEANETFDVVIMDSTDPLQEGPAYLLFTVEFFNILKNKMSSNGALVVQSNSASVIETECFTALNKTLKEVFPGVSGYSAFIPAFGLDWGFNLAFFKNPITSIDEDGIDRLISERISGELKFLDGKTMRKLFALPRDTRMLMEKETRIIRDHQPLYVI